MNTILSLLANLAATLAADAVKAALPAVNAAFTQVPADLVQSKPLVALGQTFTAAAEQIYSEATSTNLLGILGATATTLLGAGVTTTHTGSAAAA